MQKCNKPIGLPKTKPRNPLGKQRKATVPHQDKRQRIKHRSKQNEY